MNPSAPTRNAWWALPLLFILSITLILTGEAIERGYTLDDLLSWVDQQGIVQDVILSGSDEQSHASQSDPSCAPPVDDRTMGRFG